MSDNHDPPPIYQTEHVVRLDDRPVDATLDDGRVITFEHYSQDGLPKVRIKIPGRAKLKRRTRETRQ